MFVIVTPSADINYQFFYGSHLSLSQGHRGGKMPDPSTEILSRMPPMTRREKAELLLSKHAAGGESKLK
jgi:hypothetical protein